MSNDESIEVLRALDRPIAPPGDADDRVTARLVSALSEPAVVDFATQTDDHDEPSPDISASGLRNRQGSLLKPRWERGLLRAAAAALVLAGITAAFVVGTRPQEEEPVVAETVGTDVAICDQELLTYQRDYLAFFATQADPASTEPLELVMEFAGSQQVLLDRIKDRDDITKDHRERIATIERLIVGVIDSAPPPTQPQALALVGETHQLIRELVAAPQSPPFGCRTASLAWPPDDS